MPYCHVCGSEVEESANYCANCGTSLDALDRASSAGTTPFGGASLVGRPWTNALIGGTAGFLIAVVVATVFVPMYVIGITCGAGLAGFLHDRGDIAGAKVGLLAGLVATAPVLLLIVLSAVVGLGGLAAAFIGHMGPWEGVAGFSTIALLSAVALVLATIANLVFGALGGFVGGALAEQ